MSVGIGRYLAVLDVGHGNCSVLKDSGGVLVIDTGIGTSLFEFLKQNHIDRVDVILLSHADQDHISGLVHLLATKEFEVGMVRLNTDAAKQSRLWKNLLHELETMDVDGEVDWQVSLTANSGEDFSQGDVMVDVLSPGKALAAIGPGGKTLDEQIISTNTISSVIRLSLDGKGIAILPGDIDDVGLSDLHRRLTQTGQSVSAPLLVYPHHGGLSGDGDPLEFAREICKLFQPSTVVFSIGRGKHGTPRPEVVEVIRQSVANVRIACTQLSEHCSKNVPADNPKHLLQLYASGREDRACCAGTMLINLDSVNDLEPLRNTHEAFVTQSVADPLCQKQLK